MGRTNAIHLLLLAAWLAPTGCKHDLETARPCADHSQPCPAGQVCYNGHCVPGASDLGAESPPDNGPDLTRDRAPDQPPDLDTGEAPHPDLPGKDATSIDLPAHDAGKCSTNKQCDDALWCTVDTCDSSGKCANVQTGSACLISKACHKSGTPNPKNSCQRCSPSSNTKGWVFFAGKGCATTLAGDGTIGYVNGPASTARFSSPSSVAVDNSSQVWIADHGNMVIRKVSKGMVTWVAGTPKSGGFKNGPVASAKFCYPNGLAVDGSGALFVGDHCNHMIRRIELGQVSTHAGTGGGGFINGPSLTAKFDNVRRVAVDSKGRVYVADSGNHCIRLIEKGVVSVYAGDGTDTPGYKDGAANKALFNWPRGIIVSKAGAVYVADTGNHSVRKISGGLVTTVAGDGTGASGYIDGLADKARFYDPRDIALSEKTGVLYISDSNNHRIRMLQGGKVQTLAGNGIKGHADGPVLAASFAAPAGLDVDSSERLYVCDQSNHRIRLITQ